jgi:hypothetical protein
LRPPKLSVAQRWFQEGVLERATGRAASMILPSRTLRPEQRVRLYAEAYEARLVEALEEDFPAVAHHVGHRTFHRLCRRYLEAHPSRSYTLNPLGRKLPEFLAGFAGPRDLARVEVAMSEVFDAQGVPALKPSDFSSIKPERFAGLRFEFVPAFRLLELDHAVNPYIDAVRQEKAASPLKKRRSWIAVYRKEFVVWRLDLTKAAHAALSALHRGRTVGQAVAAAAEVWTGKPAELSLQIRRWFGEWATEGFFARVVR